MGEHVTRLYGAEIKHDFLGLTATATHGEQSATFTSEVDPQTNHSREPSGLQQAIAWAKEQQRAASSDKKQARDVAVAQAVEAAKTKRTKPLPQHEGKESP